MKKVILGGKSRPVHFGWAAIATIEATTGLELQALSQKLGTLSIQTIIAICYAGLLHGARKEELPFEHSIEEVADWLDADGSSMMTMIEQFTDAMVVTTETFQEGNATATKSRKKN